MQESYKINIRLTRVLHDKYSSYKILQDKHFFGKNRVSLAQGNLSP